MLIVEPDVYDLAQAHIPHRDSSYNEATRIPRPVPRDDALVACRQLREPDLETVYQLAVEAKLDRVGTCE